jgi:hypothetical protein
MSPHAQRLLAAMRTERRRRTLRYFRHHSCLTCTRAVDAANELVGLREIRAVDSEGRPVDRVREHAEGVLLEINHRKETTATK